MMDLVERIRNRPHDAPMPTEYLLDDAADHIETLETAILTIIKSMNEYLPPTGGDKDKFISEVIGAVDNRDLVRAMRKADAP